MISNPNDVTVRVPATSANLGPGYDCLGIALTLYNTARLTAGDEWGPQPPDSSAITITAKGVDAPKIPLDPGNLVYQSAALVFARAGRWPQRLALHLDGEIPVGSGLGSSSAAVVAGLLAANALTGDRLSQTTLLEMAAEIEGHPDNVAPAILGGLVLGIMPGEASDHLLLESLPVPPLRAVVVLPDFHFPTAAARAVVPQTISRADAIHNAGRMGLLVHALTHGDYGYLSTAMDDRLHQPYRLPLIPGAADALAAAYNAGAAGVALSGAGPSLIAFAPDAHEPIAAAMTAAFGRAGLAARHWIVQVEPQGARVL
jgi:homoserine kinase